MNFKRAYIWLGIVLLLAGGFLWQLMMERSSLIETNIMSLLPKDRQNPILQSASDHVTGQLERKVLFLIEGAESEQAVAAAADFVSNLETIKLFPTVSGRIGDEIQSAWGALYFPKRFQLLTPAQRERLLHHPEKQVEQVLAQLFSPFSGVTGGELQNDPFLLFREYMSELNASAGSYTLRDGFPGKTFEGREYILITAEISDSAYGSNTGDDLTDLQNLEQRLQSDHGVQVYHTGVLFYAAEGIKSGKREVSTIGIGSLIGVLLLLIMVYRSPLPIILSLLSIGCGLLAAFVVTVFVFGTIHLFSLIFGASLIGISIDYAFHYLTHRLAAGKYWQPEAGLHAIFTAITIGLITSLMGYMGLLAAPFPGLQQLALFSSVGLTAAYATVVCWYPILAAKPSVRSRLPMVGCMQVWIALWNKGSVRIGLPVLFLVLSVPGFLRISFDDDIRQLQALSPDLRAQEKVIQSVLGIQNAQQMLLVTGKDEHDVLNRLHTVGEAIGVAVEKEGLDSFQSLESYIPSGSIQRENFALVQKLYAEQGSNLWKKVGVAERPVLDADFVPLTCSDFMAAPLSEPFRFMWLGEFSPDRYGSVILLNGVRDAALLRSLCSNDPNVYYLDKATEISELFGEYRVRITNLLLIATGLIWILLAIRYGLAKGTCMVLPPLIAGLFSMAVSGFSGTSMNIFNLLALAIVLGIGIDYTLFFAEQRKRAPSELLGTLLSISLSAATTILSFGLLALSATRAIHSFGITVLIGIFISWLLAPLAMTPEKKNS